MAHNVCMGVVVAGGRGNAGAVGNGNGGGGDGDSDGTATATDVASATATAMAQATATAMATATTVTAATATAAATPTATWTATGGGRRRRRRRPRQYKASLRAHGLRPLMGDDASKQSGDAQEVMLHETAVALLRRRLTLTVPRKPWLETREAYGARLKDQAAFINVRYNLEGLSKEFPLRLQKVIDHDGGRIWK